MERKRFTTGTGRLTADQLNYALDAADQVFNPPNAWEALSWTGPILSKVKSSAQMTKMAKNGSTVNVDNRFLYDLVAVEIGSLIETSSLLELDLVTTSGHYAINLAEYANTATQAEGVTISNLPTTFSLQPVPDGSLVWAFYRPFPRVSGSTDPDERGFVAAFTQTNHFDGACP